MKSEPEKKFFPIVVALAALFQSAILAKQLARTGKVDPAAVETCLRSLLVTSPQNMKDIYGNLIDLRLGFDALLKVMATMGDGPQDGELRYYIISLMHLERQLNKTKTIQQKLTQRITQAISQASYFSPTHPQVIASLADIYSETIGSFAYHIKVVGAAAYVQNPETMNKIRALLLAGVRATVLWRQMGGSRWQLFFSRKNLIATTRLLQKNPDYTEV